MSFNSKGACPKCKGQGFVVLEMHFLDAVRTVCNECNGTRFNSDVVHLKFREKSIAEVLDLTVDEALSFFEHWEIRKRLRVLSDVGLGYLRTGQSLSTLSGGEAQRLKLASELHKQGNIYILDEPTTGLHLSYIGRLIDIIRKLTGNGNTWRSSSTLRISSAVNSSTRARSVDCPASPVRSPGNSWGRPLFQ